MSRISNAFQNISTSQDLRLNATLENALWNIISYEILRNKLISIYSQKHMTKPHLARELSLNFKTIYNISSSFKVDLEKGLDFVNETDTNNRKKILGSNKSNLKTRKTFCYFLKEAFKDHLIQEWIIASILGLVLGIYTEGFQKGWLDSSIILWSVMILAPISAWFNHERERRFNKWWNEIDKKQVIVIRNNRYTKINETELWTGDIWKVEKGDIINVSGIFIDGHILCKTSNGEVMDIDASVPNLVEITESQILFPTLTVTEGEGKVVVIISRKGKGKNKKKRRKPNQNKGKEYGQDPEHDDHSHSEDTWEHQTHSLANPVGKMGFYVGLIIAVIMFCKILYYEYKHNEKIFTLELLNQIIDAYIISEALKIAVIPEGLVMSISLSIAYSVKHMLHDHLLINHVDKIGSIAKMNYLLINKASVSKSRPKVNEAFINNTKYDKYTNENSNLIFNDIMYNTSSHLYAFDSETKLPKGNSTDNTLINFWLDNPSNKDSFRNYSEKYIEENWQYQIPFNYANNYMVSVITDTTDNISTCYLKGFIDNIETMCLNIDEYKEVIKEYQEKCYNVVVLARKEMEVFDTDYLIQYEERIWLHGYMITAVLGIKEEFQDNWSDAISLCRKAGIEVKLWTGDSWYTSLKCSQEIQWITKEEAKQTLSYIKGLNNIDKGKISFLNIITASSKELSAGVTGSDFIKECGGFNVKERETIYNKNNESETTGLIPGEGDNEKWENLICTFKENRNKDKEEKKMTLKKLKTIANKNASLSNIIFPNTLNEAIVWSDPEKFSKTVSNIKLIALANSQQKSFLLAGLHQVSSRNTIGVTYNGIYDDYSLQQADVTFSTRLTASSLEHEIYDIILLDQSFSTLLLSVEHARNIYDSIRKFVQFQWTVCFVTILYEGVGSCYFFDPPLKAVQMLWINIIMDSLGALALSTDKSSDDIMKFSPYSGRLFNTFMVVNIASQVVYQGGILIFMLVFGDKLWGVNSDKDWKHHEWNEKNGYQLTFNFNWFVFMQVFNWINSRKVHRGELNVFKGVCSNPLFIFVFFAVICIQSLIVNFEIEPIRTQRLNCKQQWLCVAIASGCVVVGLLVKVLIPMDADEIPKKQEKRIW